jgi:hypothetical protein
VGTRVSIYWPDDGQSYDGEIVDYDRHTHTHTVRYDDGEVERLDLRTEQYSILRPPAVTAKKLMPWAADMQEHFRTRLSGQATEDEIASVVELCCSSLADHTINNYKGKVKRFLRFCASHEPTPLQALPASEATALLYLRDLHDCPTISAESYQPYLSAINSMHLDLGFAAPLIGHLVDRAKKGSSFLQNHESHAPKRYWIAADHVSDVLDLALGMGPEPEDVELFRACVFLCLQFAWFSRSDTGTAATNRSVSLHDGITLVAVKLKGRKHEKWKPVYRIPQDGIPGLYTLLLRWEKIKMMRGLMAPDANYWALTGQHPKFSAKEGTEWTRRALAAVGATPPDGFRYDGHGSRSGVATGAFSIGVQLPKIQFMANWSTQSNTIHDYVDPTAPPTPGARRFFGWLAPSLLHGTS